MLTLRRFILLALLVGGAWYLLGEDRFQESDSPVSASHSSNATAETRLGFDTNSGVTDTVSLNAPQMPASTANSAAEVLARLTNALAQIEAGDLQVTEDLLSNLEYCQAYFVESGHVSAKPELIEAVRAVCKDIPTNAYQLIPSLQNTVLTRYKDVVSISALERRVNTYRQSADNPDHLVILRSDVDQLKQRALDGSLDAMRVLTDLYTDGVDYGISREDHMIFSVISEVEWSASREELQSALLANSNFEDIAQDPLLVNRLNAFFASCCQNQIKGDGVESPAERLILSQ